MPDVEKRLRYFNGQFLQEHDFIDEQAYHIDRQRRHNRTLHTPGIAEGLNVAANEGASTVAVSSGTAIDSAGHMIVLDSSRTVDIADEHRDQTLLLVISYDEQTSDPATVGGGGDTRIHERPNVELLAESDAPSADTHIRLARLVITPGGTVSQPPDLSVQTNAGVRLGGQLELNRLTLSRSGVDPTQWPTLSAGAANRADVSGHLNITGDVSVGGTLTGKLGQELVAEGDVSVRAGSDAEILVGDPVPIGEGLNLPHLFIRAISPTDNAWFSWRQGTVTRSASIQQVVFFHLEKTEGNVIEIDVKYQIFRLSEG